LFTLSDSPREVSRKFTKPAKKAGLRITLHDLRRSFGSRYTAVVPAPVLKRFLRHADIKTTLAFYTDVDDVLDDAILKG
jgi:integrase